jgi:hypothetical protein
MAQQNQTPFRGRGNLRLVVEELKRQKESRVDFVADLSDLGLTRINDKFPFGLYGRTARVREWLVEDSLDFTAGAFSQLLEKASPSVPKKFGEALLKSNPTRLVDLLNGLHADAGHEARLVRCLDGKVRAWLSDHYRMLDNYDIAFTALDVANRNKGQVIEASLSDTNMRLKFTSQAIWDRLDVAQNTPAGGYGHLGNHQFIGSSANNGPSLGEDLPGGPGTVHPLVTISNSETGHGGYRVRIGLLFGICMNLVAIDEVICQIHLGGQLDAGIFSQDTIRADSEVIMKKAADAVRTAFDQDKFKKLVARARQAQTVQITQPTAAVNHLIESQNINAEHQEALLESFLKDYSQTAFGLAQAVSRRAQDLDDGDAAYELEAIAGKIITTPALVTVSA